LETDIPLQLKTMREANTLELLRLVQQNAPCSRADLVRLSGLTAPTVSALVGALQEAGVLKFIGDGKPNGGRPPRLIEFNGEHAFVVGADIGGSTVRVAIADLSGKIRGRWSCDLGAKRNPKVVTDLIDKGIGELCQQTGISSKKIFELAAGAPGITDVRSGRVLSAPNLTNWHDVPLRELLQERTGISTTVENDVNLAALGEHWCGVARDVGDFVFLAVGTGIGAGIVMNGRLHHGANWSAGEFGYLMIPGLPHDALVVDRLGALESAIGGRGIERAWRERVNVKNGARGLRASEILQLGEKSDPVARELLENSAELLAIAITNMNLVLDVSLVVLGGGVSNEALRKNTSSFLSRNEFARPKLVLSKLGADAQLLGAIRLALLAAEAHGYQRRKGTIQAANAVSG
jgi:glucokinase